MSYAGFLNRALVTVWALVLAAILMYPAIALAFCYEPNPPPGCFDFFYRDAVFIGTVSSVRYADYPIPNSDDIEGWVYGLKVGKVFRGPARKAIRVFTENASARFPLEKGHSYLLFASASPQGLEITCCGNSAELAEAGKALKDLQRVLSVKPGTGGEIDGRRQPDR